MVRGVMLVLLLGVAIPVAAQPAADPPPPRIRRFVDVQNVHVSSRFRWVESSAGQLTSSTQQWQVNLRARFLLDPAARYTVHVGAFTGNQFVSSWNNTGGGLGTFARDFAVKQLFAAAEPGAGLELQAGGLYMLRGENTEITSYDNDAYVVGGRVTWRHAAGVLPQVSATIGHIGDYRTPNVFRRLDSLLDLNYGQLLVSTRVGPRVNVSADYTHEDGRDLMREGVTIRVSPLLPALRVDAYQRVSRNSGYGVNVSGDVRVTPAFTVTAGVAHVDRDYLIPGYMSPNADRFERGTRWYSLGTYAVTRDLSIGWFQGEAFNVEYPIPNQHRWEVLVTINPTATLKARGIF